MNHAASGPDATYDLLVVGSDPPGKSAELIEPLDTPPFYAIDGSLADCFFSGRNAGRAAACAAAAGRP